MVFSRKLRICIILFSVSAVKVDEDMELKDNRRNSNTTFTGYRPMYFFPVFKIHILFIQVTRERPFLQCGYADAVSKSLND